MIISGYVTFLINTLYTIVRRVTLLIKSVVTQSKLPNVGVGEAQHSRHAADPFPASGDRPLRL